LRSSVPILAFTPNEKIRNRLALVWGAETYLVEQVKHTDQMIKQVEEVVVGLGKCKEGDEVVVVAGTPPGVPGSTNSLRVHRIGEPTHN
jgi:pyruvate kinase